MKIRYKIFLSLTSILFLLIVVVASSYQASKRVEYYRKATVNSDAQLLAATAYRAQVRNLLLETYEIIFVKGLKGNEHVLAEADELVKTKFAELERMAQLDAANESSQTNLIALKKVNASYQALKISLDNAVALAKQNNLKKAKVALSEAQNDIYKNGLIKEITEIIQTLGQQVQTGSTNLKLSIERQMNMLWGLTVIASLTVGFLFIFVTRSIITPLELLGKATHAASQGDLQIVLPVEGSDEISFLSQDFNKMTRALQETQNQLAKQQELLYTSSKMSALGEMTAGIAHEINTPLAVIKMRAEQMEECAQEGVTEVTEYTNGLGVILKTVDRIATIINGLKFFAREGQREPARKVLVSQFIEETLSFCRERFSGHGVQLNVTTDASYPTLEIFCRSVEISQVLLNLLNNSFDAIMGKPEKWIRLNIASQEETIEITLTDSGTGIPKELREKIMQPFFTTKDVGKGTGLGLSISKGIIEQHQGKLILDTESPNTKFIIQLPKIHNAPT